MVVFKKYKIFCNKHKKYKKRINFRIISVYNKQLKPNLKLQKIYKINNKHQVDPGTRSGVFPHFCFHQKMESKQKKYVKE